MPQKTSIIVTDDFYGNPLEVRHFALKQEFNITGNFPGFRTKSLLNNTIKEAIEYIIHPFAGKIVDWFEDGHTGAFQYTTEEHNSWIHSDGGNSWAGVLYLTPDAPITSGTGFYKHKRTKNERFIQTTESPTESDLNSYYLRDYKDVTKWELTDLISNKFNRLILYDASLFHKSMDYFGKTKYDGRLFQVFFFNTEL
jgi:hypothetical protein